MVLGLENVNVPGAAFINNFDAARFLTGTGQFVLGLVLLAVVGGVFFLWYSIYKYNKDYNIIIDWFEEVNGQMHPTGQRDFATELRIPDTGTSVFYIKSRDMYLPRFTIRTGKGSSFWVAIKNNREIVNFRLKNINKDGEAELHYDHTDVRMASANLREMVKRHYGDKSKVWWKEYKDLIATVIFIFVLSISFYFLLYKIGLLLGEISNLMATVEQVIKSIPQNVNSGVVAAQ